MLKRYDLKPKRDSKQEDLNKKQRNMKLSAKNYSSQLQKSRRERPMSKGTGKMVKVKASTTTDAVYATKKAEPEVVREGTYSINEL